MPHRKLTLKPGVNLEQTPTLNQFQLAASNLIRFYNGLVQKLGGWARLTNQLFVGICRGLHAWADILGNSYVAIGTEQRLQLLDGGLIVDITPIVSTTNPAVAFSTALGSPTVTITDAAYNPGAGDWVNDITHVAVGGLVINGLYQVQSVISGTQYTITAAANATAAVTNGGAVAAYTTSSGSATVKVTLAAHGLSTGGIYTPGITLLIGGTSVVAGVMYSVALVDANNFNITVSGAAGSNAGPTGENSGNAQFQYLLPTGLVTTTGVSGFGAGDFGGGDFGGSTSGSVTISARQWSLDHFGQDLIAAPTNGKIYFWQPPTVAPAIPVTTSPPAPANVIAIFVMPQAEIIMALGAEIGGTQQPLLIRWCGVADFTDWIATAINQAGSYSVPSTGSTLVAGLAIGLGALFWTDQDVWSITYIGFPLVFGFNNIATSCGLVAQRAAGRAAGLVMWLGQHQFFRYAGGGVTPMECPVWDFFWYNFDQTQTAQIHCAVNQNFNEMAWFFAISPTSPLFNPLAPLGYVKVNYVENVWDFGLSSQYQRTAWMDHSPIGSPIGADPTGLIQAHEVGFDADGQAMQWSWQTGDFDLAEGSDFTFSDWMLPDFLVIGNPNFIPTAYTRDYPNQPAQPVVIQQFSSLTYAMTYGARGRQMSLGFAGSPADLGTFSRLGAIRVRYAPDGRA